MTMEIAFLFLSLSYCLFFGDDEVRRIGFKKSTHLPKKILIVHLSLSMTLFGRNQFNFENFVAHFSSNYSSQVNMLSLLTSFVSIIRKKSTSICRKKFLYCNGINLLEQPMIISSSSFFLHQSNEEKPLHCFFALISKSK